eukprot:13316280-Heterocapsa_arctica.AAC.1
MGRRRAEWPYPRLPGGGAAGGVRAGRGKSRGSRGRAGGAAGEERVVRGRGRQDPRQPGLRGQ